MIVTASYEAKARGVTLGMRLRDAKKVCPELVGIESDPPKYRYVYHAMMRIMSDYSPHVRMKSIDEGVIDFSQAPMHIRDRDLVEIGYEIKQRLRDEIGCWMRCNIGISTNRFLAKTAAGLHKPDGLDVLTSHNIRTVFADLKLRDLTGIARHNEQRLNAVGIYTPLDMLDADTDSLHVAFKSIVGDQWYQRLRGWEVDDTDHELKSCGRQYVLERSDLTQEEKVARLHALVEGVGAKLRHNHKAARGVRVYARLYPSGVWQAHELAPLPFYSDGAIWKVVRRLFTRAPHNIKMIAVVCYHLEDDIDTQLSLFGDALANERHVTWAIDEINGRYGERAIHSGSTLPVNNIVKTKIPFGSTRYM